MKTHMRTTAAGLLLASMAAMTAQAQTNGTWITAGSGTYSTGTNWQDGIAAGSGGSANFGSVNIPAGASTVTFDATNSLSSLTFGDTDTSTAGSWAMAGAAALTLAGSTPTITTNVNTNINAGFVLAGTNGFTKEGSGQLTVFSSTFTLTGPVNLNAGTLAINRIGGNGSTSANVGTGPINMANGTTLRMDSAGNTFVANNIFIADGATVTLSSANSANAYSGSISGNASAQINIVNNTSQAFALDRSGITQLASFNGTVNIATGNSLRFSSTSGANGNGGGNATFNVNGTIFTRNTGGAGGVVLGALTGNGTITGQSNTTAGDVAYVIGGKNIDASFTGTITNGTNGTASIRKVGTGVQSFTGSMASNGTVRVDAGTLQFAQGFSKTGTGNITVNSGGSLAGSNASLTGAATVNSGGILRPNTNPLNATDRLTFSGTLSLAGNTTFDISGANYTGVTLSTSNSLTYGGNLNVNFIGAPVAGTYDLFNFTASNPGAFTAVAVTSIGSLTSSSGVWSGTFGGTSYTFTEATGDLVVAAAAIPEPSSFAAFTGLVGVAAVGFRRRRRA